MKVILDRIRLGELLTWLSRHGLIDRHALNLVAPIDGAEGGQLGKVLDDFIEDMEIEHADPLA
jgi:hypothetical protein